MNILIDRLPETVDGLRVNTDYRYMVLFELMNQDPQIAQWEAIDRALALFYIDQPTDLDQAVEGMLWFYRCGQDPPKQTEHIGGSRGAQAYSFEQDAAYILCFLGSVPPGPAAGADALVEVQSPV